MKATHSIFSIYKRRSTLFGLRNARGAKLSEFDTYNDAVGWAYNNHGFTNCNQLIVNFEGRAI